MQLNSLALVTFPCPYSQSGNHPYEDLAKCGYKLNMKAKFVGFGHHHWMVIKMETKKRGI